MHLRRNIIFGENLVVYPKAISYYKESVVRLLDYYVLYFLLSNDYVQLDNDIGVEIKLMLSNFVNVIFSWHGWIHVA